MGATVELMDAFQAQQRQRRAAELLSKNSALLAYSVSSGESPAALRLRLMKARPLQACVKEAAQSRPLGPPPLSEAPAAVLTFPIRFIAWRQELSGVPERAVPTSREPSRANSADTNPSVAGALRLEDAA